MARKKNFESIENLRNQASKLQKRTTDKISRLRKQGLNVGGSEYDPRLDYSTRARMNRRELENYVKNLTLFNARSTQFVKGSDNVPILKSDWEILTNVQAKFNSRGELTFQQVKDIVLPSKISSTGKPYTIQEYVEQIRPEGRSSNRGIVNNPFSPINSSLGGQVSGDKVKKLTADIKKKSRPDYVRNQINGGKRSMVGFLKRTGLLGNYTNRLSRLNDKQFTSLWFFSDFAEKLFADYEAWLKATGNEQARLGDNIANYVDEYMEWAMNLDVDLKGLPRSTDKFKEIIDEDDI